MSPTREAIILSDESTLEDYYDIDDEARQYAMGLSVEFDSAEAIYEYLQDRCRWPGLGGAAAMKVKGGPPRSTSTPLRTRTEHTHTLTEDEGENDDRDDCGQG